MAKKSRERVQNTRIARAVPTTITGPGMPAEFKAEGDNMVRNGLSEAIMGFSPTSIGVQLSQVDTLFKNNRWYLVSNMRQLLSEIFVEIGLVQTICTVPVQDGLRGGFTFKTKQLSPVQLEQLQAEFEREGHYQSMEEVLTWDGLFGGAGLVIATDQDFSKPFDLNAMRPDSPLKFIAADMWELFWDQQNLQGYNNDLQRSDFEYYSYYGKKLHKSRVLPFKGITAPSFVRPRLRGWGVSKVEALVRSINQYLKAADLTFEVLDEFKLDVFLVKNLATTVAAPGGLAKVRARVQDLNQQKNYLNAMMLDAEDKYEQKQLSFSGLAEAQQGIRMQVASDMRIPMTKLFGIPAVGFQSGEDDIEVYNAMVESTVRQKAKYPFLFMGSVVCQKLFGMVPDDLTGEFKPLRVLSSEQEEVVKNGKFTRLWQVRQGGEISSKEFRDGCNKDNLLPIQLDTDDATLDEIADDQAAETEGEEDAESAPSKPPKGDAKEAKEAPSGGKPVVKNAIQEPDDAHERGAPDVMPHIVTVGLVTNQGKLLCGLRRDNNLWTSPGGHLDEGEVPLIGACREVFEETGIQVQPSSLKQIETRVVNSHRTGKDFRVTAYLGRVGEANANANNDPDREISQWRWVPIHEDSPELKPEARHAKDDFIVNHLFKNGWEE